MPAIHGTAQWTILVLCVVVMMQTIINWRVDGESYGLDVMQASLPDTQYCSANVTREVIQYLRAEPPPSGCRYCKSVEPAQHYQSL